jgi:hypothetical protein
VHLVVLFRALRRYFSASPETDRRLSSGSAVGYFRRVGPNRVAGRVYRHNTPHAGPASQGKSSNRLAEVLLAAVDGRIETLFLANGVRQWGTFDAEKRVIELHDAAHPNNEDLLDLAAVQTYLNGGTVYVVKPGEVPGGDVSAAVLRY